MESDFNVFNVFTGIIAGLAGILQLGIAFILNIIFNRIKDISDKIDSIEEDVKNHEGEIGYLRGLTNGKSK